MIVHELWQLGGDGWSEVIDRRQRQRDIRDGPERVLSGTEGGTEGKKKNTSEKSSKILTPPALGPPPTGQARNVKLDSLL